MFNIIKKLLPAKAPRSIASASSARLVDNIVRVQFITEAQIDQLSDYLHLRYQRIQKGELYTIAGHPPTNAPGIMEIDSAIILIAMEACATPEGIAEEALKKIMLCTFRKIGANISNLKVDDIKLTFQKTLLEEKKKTENAGWASVLSVIAISYLFGIDTRALSAENRVIFVDAGVKSAEDIADVYMAAKKIIGN